MSFVFYCCTCLIVSSIEYLLLQDLIFFIQVDWCLKVSSHNFIDKKYSSYKIERFQYTQYAAINFIKSVTRYRQSTYQSVREHSTRFKVAINTTIFINTDTMPFSWKVWRTYSLSWLSLNRTRINVKIKVAKMNI